MALLIALSVLFGVAMAAPQAAYKPAVYQPFRHASYAPVQAAYKPLAYSASAYSPVQTYNAPALAPAYRPIQAYNAPVAPAYRPVQAYSAPVAYSAPTPYSSSVVPAYKPQAYSAPSYQYAPQPQYAQPSYSAQYIKPIAIVRQSQDDNFDGSFSYDFEAENGIASQASGYVKNPGTEAETQVIQGQYSYTAPDGTPIVTRYYADETGFHAEGAHIPTAPVEPYRTA